VASVAASRKVSITGSGTGMVGDDGWRGAGTVEAEDDAAGSGGVSLVPT
jgi:hypothetical protein